MQLTTVPVLHRVLSVNSSQKQSAILAFLLGTLLVSFAIFHVVIDELILHSASFVLSVTVIGIRTMQLIKLRTEPDSVTRRKIWGIVIFGAVIFNAGYIVWLLDGWACGFLRSAREKIGLPWAFLLELHGWYVFNLLEEPQATDSETNRWHICTGIGAYIFIAVVDHLASGDDLQDIDESFAWPASWASRSIFAGRDAVIDSKQK
ncbi:conserved hypothetical protein [Talaromyces stipitatus ATCC 10500]|uniref:Uncharacterized protein n=1 Tax=Talaromyces stipitatus (strain ATCC 10500 / CBS 375.48 / QM 6759 / NRRL 1006) TaxID=441959 RepID=B8MMV9_TALSN|nr:uncharacterized protein TSTA_101020 [Talaromyces stipitatus ATCC 10500]EED13862.1 conserved hypothetical protein [Talaromyces stipitatus ATCC 10500]